LCCKGNSKKKQEERSRKKDGDGSKPREAGLLKYESFRQKDSRELKLKPE
jgi:preprotein translocase subunit Sec61beta